MRLVKFGSIDLPQNNATDSLPVSFRSSLVALRGGGYDQDGAAVYPEIRTISRNFFVFDDGITDIDTVINNLYKEAHKGRQILFAKLRDDTQWVAEAKLLSASTKPRSSIYIPDSIGTLAKGYEMMNITFELSYPYWQLADDTTIQFDTGYVLNDGWFLDSAQVTEHNMVASGETFSLNNTGGVAIFKGKIILTVPGGGGAITDFRITNDDTGHYVQRDGALSADDVWTIDWLTQTADLNGSNDYANTSRNINLMDIFALQLDTNNFTVTGTSITGTQNVKIEWARHYIR